MGLKDTVTNDMKTAMKAQQPDKVSTLRMLMADIKKREIDKRTPLTEEEIHKAIGTMIKQRHDSVEAFTKGNRPELAAKETAEIALLSAYLPAQLGRAEVEKIVDEAIKETGASAPADIGKVMKAALAKSGGRADGKMVNELARTKLAPK